MSAAGPDADRSSPVRHVRPANKRGVARLAAVQALYQMDVAGTSASDVVKEFELFRLRQDLDGLALREADLDWLRAIVEGVVANQRAIDPLVDDALKQTWPLRRLDLTLRAVLRAGAFEIVCRRDVPAAVAINEYVDVARAFFGGDEPGIVNGVLDRLARGERAAELPGPDRPPGHGDEE